MQSCGIETTGLRGEMWLVTTQTSLTTQKEPDQIVSQTVEWLRILHIPFKKHREN